MRFHARQRISSAGVNATAEGEVPVGMAADIEPIGVGKLGRIAVGGPDARMHIGIRRQLLAADFGVTGGAPVAELVEPVLPQGLGL